VLDLGFGIGAPRNWVESFRAPIDLAEVVVEVIFGDEFTYTKLVLPLSLKRAAQHFLHTDVSVTKICLHTSVSVSRQLILRGWKIDLS
jgi:hypothetical protein